MSFNTALTAALPAQAAGGAAVTTCFGVLPTNLSQASTLPVRVSLTPAAALTGAATNNATITVSQNRAGALTTLGTVTFAAGTNLANGVESVLTLANQPTLLPGDLIQAVQTQNGTGLATPAMCAKVEVVG